MDKTPKPVWIRCNRCKNPTNHEIVSEFKLVDSDIFYDDEGIVAGEFAYEITAQILKCMGCETITFREIFIPEDDYEARNEHIYPKRSKDSLEIKKFPNIEAKLLAIYSQSIEAYNNDLTLLCAAGLRGVIEAICRIKKIKDGPIFKKRTQINRRNNLEGKINGLVEKKILTDSQASILHANRYLGNEALHEIKIPAKEDLKKGIEIIEHIITAIFVIPKMANKLRKKSGSHF